ncbi:MAG TPA: pilus assembly protein N-terminal domain-containing protein [Candidatus Cybelea sp.]|nr:pilus assembly protein N-terminal domain-containing protein [Candidatus Cybelea sp.]
MSRGFKLTALATLLIAGVASLAVAAVKPNGTLRVDVDKAEVISLDSDTHPEVVLLANPDIADVVIERGGLLFILGKKPGETRLFVYDSNGSRILERDVVVVPTSSRSVTITRVTEPTEYSCAPRCIAVPTHAVPTGNSSPQPQGPPPVDTGAQPPPVASATPQSPAGKTGNAMSGVASGVGSAMRAY